VREDAQPPRLGRSGGELAGRPISAMALLGVGFRSISMAAASIGPVKAMLRELPLQELTELMDRLLANHAAKHDIRAELTQFAARHDIPL